VRHFQAQPIQGFRPFRVTYGKRIDPVDVGIDNFVVNDSKRDVMGYGRAFFKMREHGFFLEQRMYRKLAPEIPVQIPFFLHVPVLIIDIFEQRQDSTMVVPHDIEHI
jgi:hypothetical protein